MPDSHKFGQREYMRRLVSSLGPDRDAVVREYANAERDGTVSRKKNAAGHDPEAYAQALWRDGVRKGWLHA